MRPILQRGNHRVNFLDTSMGLPDKKLLALVRIVVADVASGRYRKLGFDP